MTTLYPVPIRRIDLTLHRLDRAIASMPEESRSKFVVGRTCERALMLSRLRSMEMGEWSGMGPRPQAVADAYDAVVVRGSQVQEAIAATFRQLFDLPTPASDERYWNAVRG